MASINVVLIGVLVLILPFAENAPSNHKNTKNDDFASRLVFVDRGSGIIHSDTDLVDRSPQKAVKKSIVTRSMPGLPTFAQNNPPLEDTSHKFSLNRRMDDERQNWGIIVDDRELTEEESYYNRPLTLPKNIDTQMLRNETPKKNRSKMPNKRPEVAKLSACDTATVNCCIDLTKVKKCFAYNNCLTATEDMFSTLCSKANVEKIINDMVAFYKAPSRN